MSVAFYSAAALFSFHIGRWADRRGALGTLVGLGLGIVSLSFLGFFLALNFTTQSVLYASVIVLSSIAGFGTTFYHPLSATIIRSAFPYTESGKALGFSGALGSRRIHRVPRRVRLGGGLSHPAQRAGPDVGSRSPLRYCGGCRPQGSAVGPAAGRQRRVPGRRKRAQPGRARADRGDCAKVVQQARDLLSGSRRTSRPSKGSESGRYSD